MFKILIRPLEESDAKISWKWRNDPEIWNFTGSRPDMNITYEIEYEWIQRVLKEDSSRRFAIIVDDIYVGNIQLTNITMFDAEYHIFIGDKRYWGKGIGTLATAQILRYAKEVLGLKDVYLFVNPLNIGAIKLYKKSGFIQVSDKIKMNINLNNMLEPIVSIFMMAYNHEDYIEQALQGVLMQKTSFDFDIVLGEDCSKDNTRKIILEYADKYPGKFKLILHESNIGALANQNAILKKCLGKYIAICEGDDYWTDPLKLQKQVDFLENNLSFSLCCGGYKVLVNNVIEKEITYEGIGFDEDKIGFGFGLEDMKNRWLTMPLNLVFRRNIIDFQKFKEYQHMRDVHINYHLLKLGDGYFFKEIFGVYRVHEGGVFSMKSQYSYLINAYDIFKELYVKNPDGFTRYKYFKHTVALLHYELYRNNINLERKLELLKEAKLLAKTKKETKFINSVYNPKSFIFSKLLYLKRIFK